MGYAVMPIQKWAILGESRIGTSHIGRNTPCQDVCRFELFGTNSDWLVVAVADGAGSAAMSEIGARMTCDRFVERIVGFSQEFVASKSFMIDLFSNVRDEIIAEAERLVTKPRELACTAMLAVIGPDSAAFAQLGDGAIIVGMGEDARTIFWPEPSEYANATDFLTDDGFRDRIHFESLTGTVREIAALTDGLQRLALDFSTQKPHQAFFRPFFERLRTTVETETLIEPLRSFLDSPRVNDRTDDDKTLVLAVRLP